MTEREKALSLLTTLEAVLPTESSELFMELWATLERDDNVELDDLRERAARIGLTRWIPTQFVDDVRSGAFTQKPPGLAARLLQAVCWCEAQQFTRLMTWYDAVRDEWMDLLIESPQR